MYVSVCVSVCVCVSVFISIISKSSYLIWMKFGRMMYNDKRQVPFEDELTRLIRTEVKETRIYTFSNYVPLIYFSDVTSPFLLLER